MLIGHIWDRKQRSPQTGTLLVLAIFLVVSEQTLAKSISKERLFQIAPDYFDITEKCVAREGRLHGNLVLRTR